MSYVIFLILSVEYLSPATWYFEICHLSFFDIDSLLFGRKIILILDTKVCKEKNQESAYEWLVQTTGSLNKKTLEVNLQGPKFKSIEKLKCAHSYELAYIESAIQSIINYFYHPDFTVGNGISPFQSHFKWESRTLTAGRELSIDSPCPEEFISNRGKCK